LPVNKNTMTALLPLDFDEEVFIGYIDKGIRVPIYYNKDLVNEASINLISPENECSVCHSDTSLTNSLDVSETVNVIQINGSNYDETVKKTVMANGDYWIEKTSPYWDSVDSSVKFSTTKELITTFETSKCGCIKDTHENQCKVKEFAPAVHSCYFTSKTCSCSNTAGSFKIFEETGVIQLSSNFNKEHLYLEYSTFMPKVRGEYMVPAVAFETLVAWVKFKSVENKKSVGLGDRQWHLKRYTDERSNMNKIRRRVKISTILHYAMSVPKFDIAN
jgi:hypothetical protein